MMARRTGETQLDLGFNPTDQGLVLDKSAQ